MLESLFVKSCADPRAWVESHIEFPPVSSPNQPGRCSLDRQPWMSAILADVLDPSVDHIHLVMGTQTGKTTSLILATALLAEFDPAPLIWALPTDDLARTLRRNRLLPVFQASPVLAAKLPANPRAITKGEVPLSTMTLYSTGVQTPAKLSSTPAAYIIADESAKYDHVRKNEASPLLLLQERTKGFARKLIIEASTPNTEEHPFWQGFLASDQRYYYVPCPHCHAFQKLIFSRETIQWDPKHPTLHGADRVRSTARYVCASCGGWITDADKPALLANGEWHADNPSAPSNLRGYHLNSLYAPYQSFGEVALAFWRAVHSVVPAEDLQNFVNSWQALPYTSYAARITDAQVSAFVDPSYSRGSLPLNPGEFYYIVTGYDPGQNATHWVTCAVSTHGALWVLDWGTLVSFSSEAGRIGPAAHLETLRYGPSGARPSYGFVDSGDWTQTIYAECERSPFLTPCKGSSGSTGSLAVTTPKFHPRLSLVLYSDFAAKTGLYNQIMTQRQTELHLPSDTDPDLVAGLSGQTLEKLPQGRRRWKALPNDHYGDALKLCMVSWWVHRETFEPFAMDSPAPENPAPAAPASSNSKI